MSQPWQMQVAESVMIPADFDDVEAHAFEEADNLTRKRHSVKLADEEYLYED